MKDKHINLIASLILHPKELVTEDVNSNQTKSNSSLEKI